MSNDTDSTNETSWAGVLGGKGLLGVGLLLVLINVAVSYGMDTRINAWLCYLDARYWSGYFSVALWLAAIWLASESTEFVEDYLPVIRIILTVCALLVVIFTLQNVFNTTRAENAIWFNAILMIAACCIVRSLFLFYDYRYEGGESIDMEETQWFWGMSGFMFAVLIIFGIMHMIPVTTRPFEGADFVVSESLLSSCWNGLRESLQNGNGSFASNIFGIFLFMSSITFIYVAGKWMLIFVSKMRGN